MTDYDREAVARLEAKLRGWTFHHYDHAATVMHVTIPPLRAITPVVCLDLDDPGDLLKLVRLLLLPMLNGQYHAAWKPGGDKNSVQANSPAEAIRTAVIALAEEEHAND